MHESCCKLVTFYHTSTLTCIGGLGIQLYDTVFCWTTLYWNHRCPAAGCQGSSHTDTLQAFEALSKLVQGTSDRPEHWQRVSPVQFSTSSSMTGVFQHGNLVWCRFNDRENTASLLHAHNLKLSRIIQKTPVDFLDQLERWHNLKAGNI